MERGALDFTIFVSHLSGEERDGETGYYYASIFSILPDETGYNDGGTTQTRQTVTTLDFEVGRDIGVGETGANVRFFGGVRFAEFEQTAENHFYGDFTVTEDWESRFRGIGPRVGADVDVPAGENISMNFSGSGSVLWGETKTQTILNVTDNATRFTVFDDHVTSSSADRAAYNLEGEVGVSAHGDGITVTAGVRGEAWFNVTDTSNSSSCLCGTDGSYGTPDADQYFWGPFIRLVVRTGE